MKRLLPLSTYSSPSRTAMVRMAAESEPEPASVSAYAGSQSPPASFGRYASFWACDPASLIPREPSSCTASRRPLVAQTFDTSSVATSASSVPVPDPPHSSSKRRPKRSCSRKSSTTSHGNSCVASISAARGATRSRASVRTSSRISRCSSVRTSQGTSAIVRLCGEDPAAHFGEKLAPEHELVAVLEERALAPVREPERLLPVQRQLDQAALAPSLGAGDRPRRHQVARADARPVRRRVRELLRHRPVEAAGVAARDDGAVQLHLEREVERPRLLRAEVRQRRGLLRRRGYPAFLEQRERRHPRGDRRREALAEEGAERDVLPRLQVARAPVVDKGDAEDVLAKRVRRYGLPQPARRADDEAELELDVEPTRRAEHGRIGVRRLRLAARPPNRRAADDDGAGPAVI